MTQSTHDSLRCPNCHGSLVLTFESSRQYFNGVSVELTDCPTLHCSDCEFSFLPPQLQSSLSKNTAQAAAQGQHQGSIRFRDNQRRFQFCRGVEFIYDYRDNYYLPGLFRGENDGFLTPVFFRPHVLHKYRHTSGYRVDMVSNTYGTIYFPSGDYLSFGMNRCGEVIAWLGDLDRLPISEQHYCRSENIDSSHNIASEFYDAQIDIAFTDPSKEQRMFLARAEFIRRVKSVIESDPTLLDAEAKTLLKEFSPPLDKGRDAALNAFHDLHKICVETISQQAFVQDLKHRETGFSVT